MGKAAPQVFTPTEAFVWKSLWPKGTSDAGQRVSYEGMTPRTMEFMMVSAAVS